MMCPPIDIKPILDIQQEIFKAMAAQRNAMLEAQRARIEQLSPEEREKLHRIEMLLAPPILRPGRAVKLTGVEPERKPIHPRYGLVRVAYVLGQWWPCLAIRIIDRETRRLESHLFWTWRERAFSAK